MNSLTIETTRIVSTGFAAMGMEMYIMIFVLILLLVGGKKIPELMRGVGKGVGELQKGLEEGKQGLHSSIKHDETLPATPVVVAQVPKESEPREEPKAPTA